MRFVCTRVAVRIENTRTPWTSLYEPGDELTLPVAHNEGNYFADERTIAELEDEGAWSCGTWTPERLANDIAGVCNAGGNVVGLMPHPERVSDPALGSEEGLKVFESVLSFAGART
jgi:phosphoribosylformylglycinamidine synthase